VKEEILAATIDALGAVTEPRFFRTERGYQGRFYCTLQAELDRRGLLGDGVILEMEYQKSARHNLRQRPDIILHVPAEESGLSVAENNFAVFALKWKASPADAVGDFEKLDAMCDQLRYPLAVFINVASELHYRDLYTGPFPDRLHTFGVSLVDGALKITGG
jgi:hypothetical protein